MEPATDQHCLREPTLLGYVRGELSDEDAREAEVHLDTCEACLEVVAVLGGSPSAVGDQTSASDRYEIGEPIATGGMGRIFSAWDKTLDRAVALKTVRISDALSRERFAREMVVTARLQHPAIVPVYDGGFLADGTPYYVMRRVDGRELEVCIANADSVPARLEFLRPFIALVDAVAYAHAERFVHRDLKPRNVLVGPFGETVVLDWGLAKDLDDAQATEPQTLADHEPQPGLTSTGAVMGTPGYIAPEIARGEGATTRSDVYSLGVILARILTGEPAQSALALHDSSLVGAPADLVAIAARATANDPDRRYTDAAELAADLEHFEAGRLVNARTYGLLDRVVRFVRRHRAAVTVAGVAGFTLLAFGGWSYRNVSGARADTQLALEDAQTQRASAEQEREAAEELIDFALEELSQELETTGHQDLLGGLIGEVEAYYEGRDRPEDPGWAFRRARALELKATIDRTSGRDDSSDTSARAALALLSIATENPALVREADLLRCEILRGQAMELRNRADLEGAQEAAAACISIADRYLAEDPDDRRWRMRRAEVELAQLLIVLARGQTDPARSAMRRLLAGLEGVQWQGQDLAVVVNIRRVVHGQLGLIALRNQRPDEAIEHYRRGLEDSVYLRTLRPGNAAAIKAVAGARMELGAAFEALRRYEDAQRQLEMSVSIFEVLLELDPDDVVWAQNLSLSRRKLTGILLVRELPEQAVAVARANVADMRALAERVPASSTIALDLGFVLADLGDLLARTGAADEGAAPFEEGLERMDAVVTQNPGDVLALRKLAYIRLLHGEFEITRGNLEPAAESLVRARELAQRELERQPSPGNRLRVAEPTARLVVVQWRLGNVDEARALLGELRSEIAQAKSEGANSPLSDDLLGYVEQAAESLDESP